MKLAINAPKDGRGIGQKQVLEQNLSSTDVYGRTFGREVHGCTTVEDGSNGLTAPMILRFYLPVFLNTLFEAFLLLL